MIYIVSLGCEGKTAALSVAKAGCKCDAMGVHLSNFCNPVQDFDGGQSVSVLFQ